jgi:hypothetical protein
LTLGAPINDFMNQERRVPRRNTFMADTTVNDLRPRRADAVTAPITEDWLAVVLGLAIFVLALAALVNVDLIGWVVTTSVWSNFSQALKATSKDFSSLGGYGALAAT